MADPAIILAIVNGSVGLALKVGTVIKHLNDISQKLKYVEIEILSIVTECETIQTAWNAIEKWARLQTVETDDQQALLERLDRSLILGSMVISALDDDLVSFATSTQSSGFLRRSKFAWNDNLFSQHQQRIRGQVGAMSLLLQAINLSSPREQSELLEREKEVLRSSDESAWTIVPSRLSISTRNTDGGLSVESSEVVYRPLDFEDNLFTARVYKRNYRPLRLRQTIWRGGKEQQMENQPDIYAPRPNLAKLISSSGQGMDRYEGISATPLDDLVGFALEPLKFIGELADDLDAGSLRELMERDQRRQGGGRMEKKPQRAFERTEEVDRSEELRLMSGISRGMA